MPNAGLHPIPGKAEPSARQTEDAITRLKNKVAGANVASVAMTLSEANRRGDISLIINVVESQASKLRFIDSLLARHTALDDLPNAAQKIEKAIQTAAESDRLKAEIYAVDSLIKDFPKQGATRTATLSIIVEHAKSAFHLADVISNLREMIRSVKRTVNTFQEDGELRQPATEKSIRAAIRHLSEYVKTNPNEAQNRDIRIILDNFVLSEVQDKEPELVRADDDVTLIREALSAKTRHLLDIYELLGVTWNTDPFPRIKELLAHEETIKQHA